MLSSIHGYLHSADRLTPLSPFFLSLSLAVDAFIASFRRWLFYVSPGFFLLLLQNDETVIDDNSRRRLTVFVVSGIELRIRAIFTPLKHIRVYVRDKTTNDGCEFVGQFSVGIKSKAKQPQ